MSWSYPLWESFCSIEKVLYLMKKWCKILQMAQNMHTWHILSSRIIKSFKWIWKVSTVAWTLNCSLHDLSPQDFPRYLFEFVWEIPSLYKKRALFFFILYQQKVVKNCCAFFCLSTKSGNLNRTLSAIWKLFPLKVSWEVQVKMGDWISYHLIVVVL